MKEEGQCLSSGKLTARCNKNQDFTEKNKRMQRNYKVIYLSAIKINRNLGGGEKKM